MAVGAFSSCVPAISRAGVIVGAVLVFSLIAIPRFIVWVSFGAHLRNYLEQSQHRRYFNVGMAALLLASPAPLFSIE